MKTVTFLVFLAVAGAAAFHYRDKWQPLLLRGPATAGASDAAAAPPKAAPQAAETVVTHLGDVTLVFDAGRDTYRFPVAISPDWKHVALVRPLRSLRGAPSSGTELDYDGAPVATYAAIALDSFTWSDDRATYAFVATRSARNHVVVVGGAATPAGDLEFTGPLVLSRDGRRWAKARAHAMGLDKPRRLWVDGAELDVDADVTAVRFAPGDNRLVYQSGGRWFLDKLPDQPYHALEDLLITADGRTYIFHQPVPPDGDASANRLVVATIGSAPREYPGGCRPVLSPDGRRYAFVVVKDAKSRVVVDGDDGPAHDGVQAVGFSPDGTRVFYRAVEASSSNRYVLFLDGRLVASSTVEPPSDPVFGDSAKSVAFWTDEGGKRLIRFNGKTVADGPQSFLPLLAVSRDGQWLGVYGEGSQPAVYGAEGHASAGSNDPNALFARPRPRVVVRRVTTQPGERTFAKTQQELHVNGSVVASFDHVIHRERADGPWQASHFDEATNTVTAYGVRDGKVIRVEIKMTPAAP